MPSIETFVLANGLQVYLLMQPGAQRTAVHYALRGGAEDGTLVAPGVASFVMSLATHDETTLPFFASDLAGIQGYVDRNGGYVLTSARADQLEDTLLGLARWIGEARISTRVLRSVAFAHLDQLDAVNYQTTELARCHALRVLYGDTHPLGQSMFGELDDIARLTTDQIAAHQRLMFAPETSALILSGDLTAVDARALVTRHFGQLEPSSTKSLRRMSLGETPKNHVRALMTPGDVALLVQAFPAPAAESSERPAFELLALIAGSLTASRVNTALRERVGQTYGVNAHYEARRLGGTWVLETAVDPKRTLDSLYIIDAELNRLRTEQVKQDELLRARTQLREHRRSLLSDASGAAGLVAEAFVASEQSVPLDLPALWQRYDSELQHTTAEDVRSLAARALSEEARAAVVAGNLSGFIDQVKHWNKHVDTFVPESVIKDLEAKGFVRRPTEERAR